MALVNGMGQGWREWIIRASSARTVSRVVASLTGIAGVTAMSIEAAALIRDRAADGVSALLFAGLPILIVGQVWGVAWTTVRKEAQRRSPRDSRGRVERVNVLLGPLNRRATWALTAVLVVVFVVAVTAAIGVTGYGGPTSPAPGCPYRLLNHGSFSCVTRALYEHVGGRVQRFAAGILTGFYLAQFGSALGGLKTQTNGEVFG